MEEFYSLEDESKSLAELSRDLAGRRTEAANEARQIWEEYSEKLEPGQRLPPQEKLELGNISYLCRFVEPDSTTVENLSRKDLREVKHTGRDLYERNHEASEVPELEERDCDDLAVLSASWQMSRLEEGASATRFCMGSNPGDYPHIWSESVSEDWYMVSPCNSSARVSETKPGKWKADSPDFLGSMERYFEIPLGEGARSDLRMARDLQSFAEAELE